MTELNYVQKEHTLEVSVRIFTDDFERVLRKSCSCKVALIKPVDKFQTDKQVADYISKHLRLKLDGKLVPLRFAGYEQEEGGTWSYFEVAGINSLKKIELINNLLYDDNDQQVNMLHIQGYGKERTDKLEFPITAYSFNF